MGTKSSALFNALDAASNAPDASAIAGRVRVLTGNIALASGDLDSGDIIKLAPIPSNAVPLSIVLFNDDLDSGTTLEADVGLYDQDGNVEHVDAFADGDTSLRGPVTAGTELICQDGADAVALYSKRIWEWAGLTADDFKFHDICITFTAAGDTGGDLAFKILYVVD
jgi:hypothetical protein